MPVISTPRQAEANAAHQMRALGYFDAHVTRSPDDGSINVRSSTANAAAAVQRRTAPVSGSDLREFLGAATPSPPKDSWLFSMFARRTDRAPEMWFFAASGYVQSAVQYADNRSILLFTYSLDTGELTPVNQVAANKLHSIAAQRAARGA